MALNELTFYAKEFAQLDRDELYAILNLRSAVFVVEQNCAYQDVDGRDQAALHIIGKLGKEIVAYARCFPPGEYFEQAAIGRVLIKQAFRQRGFAHHLMLFSIKTLENHYQTRLIKLSAQQYLIDFYRSHGFETQGKGYLEDGIPHIAMLRRG